MSESEAGAARRETAVTGAGCELRAQSMSVKSTIYSDAAFHIWEHCGKEPGTVVIDGHVSDEDANKTDQFGYGNRVTPFADGQPGEYAQGGEVQLVLPPAAVKALLAHFERHKK